MSTAAAVEYVVVMDEENEETECLRHFGKTYLWNSTISFYDINRLVVGSKEEKRKL